MRLEEIEDGFPDLSRENGGVERIKTSLGAGTGAREAGYFARAHSFRTVPVAIPVLAVHQGLQISFGAAHTDGGSRVDAFSAGGFAGAAGGVDAGIDALDLTAPASSAGDAGPHIGRSRRNVCVGCEN